MLHGYCPFCKDDAGGEWSVWVMHGRDLSLTESCTEEEWVTRLLSCCAEVFNVRKQNFRDKVLFLF